MIFINKSLWPDAIITEVNLIIINLLVEKVLWINKKIQK